MEGILKDPFLHAGLTLHVDRNDCYLFLIFPTATIIPPPFFFFPSPHSDFGRFLKIASERNYYGVSEYFESVLINNSIQFSSTNICGVSTHKYFAVFSI